jgi:hypothetical protein
MKLEEMKYYVSLLTSGKTHYVSIANISPLIMFMKVIAAFLGSRDQLSG